MLMDYNTNTTSEPHTRCDIHRPPSRTLPPNIVLTDEKYPRFVLSDEAIESNGLSKTYTVHDEATNTFSEMRLSEMPISSSYYGTSDLLHLLDGKSGFVATPGYWDTTEEKMIDFQLATTGSIKGPDTRIDRYHTTAHREVGEEIGMNARLLNQSGIKTHDRMMVNTYVASCSGPSAPIQEPKGRDNKGTRVMVWCLVDKKEDVIGRRRLKSKDTAGQKVVLVPVDELRTLIQLLFPS